MKNGFIAGQPIVAKNTPLNKNLGINHKFMDEAGRGHIALVKDDLVSFYFQKKTYSGAMEAKTSLREFNENFEVVSNNLNSAYVKTHHYTKRYPNDFQNR